MELPLPEQIVVELGETDIVGKGLTVKVTVAALLLHIPKVPVTV